MTELEQKEYEKPIAERFLARRRGGYGIIDFDQKRPDFRVANGDGDEAGLELMRYREQGWQNQAHDHNEQMTRFIGDEWIDDESVHHVYVHLWYKEARETGFALVRNRDWPGLVVELKRLVKTTGELPLNEPTFFAFLKEMAPDAANILLAGKGKDRIRRAEDYPLLSEHFDEVILTRGIFIVHLPHTSVSCRNTAADVEELQRALGEHLRKLPEYRAKLPGAPMWLLIHSDGWPPMGHISNDHIMQDLLRAAKRITTSADHKFDEVWWLDNAVISREPTLHPVA